MNSSLVRSLLCLMVLAMASCQQSQTVAVCGEDSSDTADVPLLADGGSNNVNPSTQDGGGGSGGGFALLGDGASCDVDEQCENAFCMPSQNSFGAGYCYGIAMEGCIVVGDPSPFKAQCASFLKALYVCGESWDVSLLGTCAEIGQGAIGERYHCCDKL